MFFVGVIPNIAPDYTTPISCASSQIKKEWTLNKNPRFLIDSPIRVMIAIMAYEVCQLNRGLMVAVRCLHTISQSPIKVIFSYGNDSAPLYSKRHPSSHAQTPSV